MQLIVCSEEFTDDGKCLGISSSVEYKPKEDFSIIDLDPSQLMEFWTFGFIVMFLSMASILPISMAIKAIKDFYEQVKG